MARVAFLAALVDALVGEFKCRASERFFRHLVTLRAIVGEGRMVLRNRAGIINVLAVSKVKPGNRRRPGQRNQEDGQEAQSPPVMGLAKIIEVALKALGDLFLCASIERHKVCVARAATVKAGL